MIPVKAVPRFRCDHCNKTGTKATIKRHEPRCFRNPERFCDACQNTGTAFEMVCGCLECRPGEYVCTCDGQGMVEREKPCPYCEKYQAFLAWENHVDGLVR